MFDLNEIMKRARQASGQATDSMKKTFEKSEEIVNKIEVPTSENGESQPASEAEGQMGADAQRQVEILGQIWGADTVEGLMGQMFGEGMGVIAAALETLEMEEEDDEEEDASFGPEQEQELYSILEEAMSRMNSLPEPEEIPYQKDDARWERFGILLSGIVSKLNGHDLYGMDVEEHIPVLEQQVASIVRRSWGINGRGGLLAKIRYLTQEGYVLRYRLYGEASSPEEQMEEGMDEEERESVARAWRFVNRYKNEYAPGFLTGWDIGRAAMLARWGCYLGWITKSEAAGILWDLSGKATEELHSWREFAQSYLFGGLMWKILCGDRSAGSYLGYIADAATELLAGKADQDGGQWRECPWPARRKIGFT